MGKEENTMELPFNYSELTERRLRSLVDYSLYFENDSYEGAKIAHMDIGRLNLPSGRLMICDPVLLGMEGRQCLPFEHELEPGQYPVTLCVVRGNTAAGGDRYAALRVVFSEKRPVKWLLALNGEENLAELTQDGDYFGFPVREGFGCLLDMYGRERFIRLCAELRERDGELISDYIEPKLLENRERFPLYQREEGDWFNDTLPGGTENLILFQTGFGDGLYPCYWGVDEDNMAAQLVADFFVLGYSHQL